MPSQRNSRPDPPEVMTWMKASKVLAVCAVFDALRLFFQSLWITGPALALAYCTAEASGTISKYTFGLLGTKTAALACGAVVGSAGYASYPALVMFGTVMAMAVGLLGWLIVLLMNMQNNVNMVKKDFSSVIKYGISLLVSETPIIGAFPALTVVNFAMFKIQIREGKETLKKYEEEQAAALKREREEQTQTFVRARAARASAEAEAADQMENADEIPEQLPMAA